MAKPDPNNYKGASGKQQVGFTKNPVAGGTIPYSGSGEADYVNGVDHVDEESEPTIAGAVETAPGTSQVEQSDAADEQDADVDESSEDATSNAGKK